MAKGIANGIQFLIQRVQQSTMVGTAEKPPSGLEEGVKRIAKETAHYGVLDAQDGVTNRTFQPPFEQVRGDRQHPEYPEGGMPAYSPQAFDHNLRNAAGFSQ